MTSQSVVGSRQSAGGDRQIEQELQAALLVEPSPEFVAKVRSRIASEPAPGRRWMMWLLPAAGLAAAAVAFAVFVQRPASGGADRSLIASRALPSIVVPIVEEELWSGSSPTSPTILRQTVDQAEPVVLVDPRESAALRRLIAGSAESRPVAALWLRPSPLSIAEPAAISDLEIPELVIDPLPIGSEGVRQ